MFEDPLSYYSTHGPTGDPGKHVDLFAGLPGDLPSLVQAVQGVMLHVFWAERYGVNLPEERKVTVNTRSLADKLAIYREVDPRPLCEPRPLDRRLMGNCRDFSQLLSSMLRQQGVPARPRCGFGTYFLPNHYEDHWICEVWNAAQERWGMVDAQLDPFQQEILQIDFDPLDVPGDRFIAAGKAWQMCRRGEADPDTFGIFEWHGLWFIRANLVRDILSLNKIEILPWDGGFGYIDRYEHEASEEDWAYESFDRMAELTQGGNAAFGEIRRIYASDDKLRVPEEWT